ncbi:MAG: FecR domain-containing protein [Cyanobacteria bacterium P01_H01_bin.21]
MCKVSARWYSLLLGAAFIFGFPVPALAQTSLTWAKVERLRNRVHLIPRSSDARLARVADVMSIGDSLRTSSSSRAELRFNDGSLARVGEQATFRFTPNTRNFQLSNGTVLLLIPPGRGRTTIQTPNAVTGIQGSALFVRAGCLTDLTADGYCDSPMTLVGALTNNPAGAMMAYNHSGSEQQPLSAGEMVVIENDVITQLHEFDLRTFYETSGLVEGLQLDSPTPPETLSEDLRGVWQEIQDALELQGDFDDSDSSQEVVINPGFISSVVGAASSEEAATASAFAGFPSFESSPAAFFHILGEQVATARPNTTVESSGSEVREASLVAPITSAQVRDVLVDVDAPINQRPGELSVVNQPSVPSVQPEPVASPGLAPTIVETPSPVAEPIQPEVPIAPETPVPAIEQPTPVAPVVQEPVTAPPTVAQPEPVAVDPPTVPEADQIPDRQPVPEGSFDWDQQPEGANNPEVVVPEGN